MKLWKTGILFALGGCGYVATELLWRGRSHGSMFLAGGTCFLLLGKLNRQKLSLPLRALAGAGIITGVELIAGLLWNREYRIWDYRETPCNFLGQVCLPYSLLWIPLGVFAMKVHKLLSGALSTSGNALHTELMNSPL